MRKTLRIVFILIAIIVLGLGVYFAFFGKDRSLSVYKKANSVLEYKYNLDVYGDMLGLDKLGYANNTAEFSPDEFAEIFALRERMFETEDKLQAGSEGELFYFYGYAKYEDILTEAIKYYTNYASLAKDASKRYSNSVISSMNNYKSAMANVFDEASYVKSLQNNFGLEESEVNEDDVYEGYKSLRVAYRDYLKKAATVVVKLRDYIVEESFNNNYNFETIAVLYDSIANTMITTMNSKIEQEINFLHDLSIYVDKYLEYTNIGSISYGITDEITYLNAYNKLYFEDREDYDKIFNFTHFQKYDLLHGRNNISTTLKLEYVEDATIVCGLLNL